MYGENAHKYDIEKLYDELKTSRRGLSEKAHIIVDTLYRDHDRIYLLPFDPSRRMMTSRNKCNDGIYAFTKGASKETVLALEPTENLESSEEAGYDA
jgi:magnesium-transporting ATPase (P-type)